jgi:precorrin-6A/cobalt-precorrin-6A reductase
MHGHAIDVLVTRDSGGAQTAAKLTAARKLGLPVVMVDRPAPPDAPAVATTGEAITWLEQCWPAAANGAMKETGPWNR